MRRWPHNRLHSCARFHPQLRVKWVHRPLAIAALVYPGWQKVICVPAHLSLSHSHSENPKNNVATRNRRRGERALTAHPASLFFLLGGNQICHCRETSCTNWVLLCAEGGFASACVWERVCLREREWEYIQCHTRLRAWQLVCQRRQAGAHVD